MAKLTKKIKSSVLPKGCPFSHPTANFTVTVYYLSRTFAFTNKRNDCAGAE